MSLVDRVRALERAALEDTRLIVQLEGRVDLLEGMKMDEPLLQFFRFAHLPEPLQQVAEPFDTLARHIDIALPRNPERTVCLRKLLEAKDCAIRARLYEPT
jgi:hypothetical protein